MAKIRNSNPKKSGLKRLRQKLQHKYCPQCGLKIEWGDENEES